MTRVGTLVAVLACALAAAVAEAPAEIAATGAVGALAVSPQGGRVLVGIDGARPGSWLFASDDHGLTWVKAHGLAGAAGVTAIGVRTEPAGGRLHGRDHAPLGSSG